MLVVVRVKTYLVHGGRSIEAVSAFTKKSLSFQSSIHISDLTDKLGLLVEKNIRLVQTQINGILALTAEKIFSFQRVASFCAVRVGTCDRQTKL